MAAKRTLIPGKLRDPEAPKVGRPSKEDQKARQIETILEEVSGGASLESVCKKAGMPTPAQFRAWTRGDQELRKAWREARADQAHALFDKIADLTQELAEGDWGKDDNAKVTALRVSIDGLKHITARLLPEAYAEQKPGSQGISVTVVTSLPVGPGAIPGVPVDTTFKAVAAPPKQIEHENG